VTRVPTPIAMPKLGMTMREGTVVAWPVPVGAPVAKGQLVLVIESEKAEVEIEAPASGVLRHVWVEPPAIVPCGTLLAAITATADEPFDPDAFRREHDRPEAPVAPAPAAAVAPLPAAGPRAAAPAITPAARTLARQLGVDPAVVPGTGPGGRVTREDVEAWVERRRSLVPVADGVALEAPATGAGDPVLLLPGFGTDVSAFARQIPALAERFRVVGVNPRGVGQSNPGPAERHDVATSAADAAALPGAPAHVIGASLGAAVALELALTLPARVRSLTLVTPFVDAGPRLLAVLDAWCRVARTGPADTLARMLLPWLFSARTLADDAARERVVRGLAAIVARIPASTLDRSAAGLRAWSGTRRDALRDVAVPTLVLGAGDDLLTPGVEAIAAAIPRAACVVVPGAGHAVCLEAPDAVNAAILRHVGGS